MSSHGRFWGYRVNCPHRVKGCIRNEIRQGLGLKMRMRVIPLILRGFQTPRPLPLRTHAKSIKKLYVLYVTM